ncbi:MAG: SpoIIE family protein phosphatase [Acidobacteriaceae bacterium]|nr:SpoIIE family protein phosphatase [Acidobacteriaceae bacterium]MBV9781695.1 SpoIIE family protein phosphatase [Acidobacteriaceae bacterium]
MRMLLRGTSRTRDVKRRSEVWQFAASIPSVNLKQALAQYHNPLSSPHWQEVPLSRLRNLALGIMLTTSSGGFVMDIIAMALVRRGVFPIGIWSGIPAGLLFGVGVTAQVLSKVRKQNRKLLSLAGWPIAAGVSVCYVIAVTRGAWPELSIKGSNLAIAIDCMSLVVCTVTGYNCLLRFINHEGMSYARAATELQHAYRIQSTLVPPVSARSHLAEVFGRTSPSEQVGGDLVDVVPLSDSSVFAYVADISGHGLNAGILMGMYKTAVRVGLEAHQDAGSLLNLLNDVMRVMKDPSMYATFGCLRFTDKGMEYALAGHPAMLHYNAADD